MIDTSQGSYEMDKNNMNDLMKQISEEVKLEIRDGVSQCNLLIDALDDVCDEKILDWRSSKEDWITLQDYLINVDEYNKKVDLYEKYNLEMYDDVD